MPVIRYRTRDLTRLLPPSARSMRRMAKITGRSDDMLIIRGVNVFPTQIEESCAARCPSWRQYSWWSQARATWIRRSGRDRWRPVSGAIRAGEAWPGAEHRIKTLIGDCTVIVGSRSRSIGDRRQGHDAAASIDRPENGPRNACGARQRADTGPIPRARLKPTRRPPCIPHPA